MYNELDKQLSDKIKQVFDDYEDDGVDLGWEKLKGHLINSPTKTKSNAWYKAVAAIAILGLGVWATFHLYNNEKEPLQVSQKQSAVKTSPSLPLNAKEKQKIQDIHNSKTSPSLLASISPKATKSYVSGGKNQSEGEIRKEINTGIDPAEKSPASIEAPSMLTLEDNSQTIASTNVLNKTEVIQDKQQSVLTQLSEEERHRIQGEKLALLEKKGLVNSSSESYNTDKHKGRLVDVAVTAGSFVNYAEGSKATVNPSVGISSEIKIGKRLSVGTGLMLAQNNLRYSSNNNPQAEIAVMSAISRPVSNDVPTLGLQGLEARAMSYSASGYDASLTGLDIPVNLKYIISEARNDIYVAAGVSSNYFFSEDYTYHYQRATASGARTPEAIGRTGSSFNLARMLNLSLGMGYPIGGKNKLSFEPFVKYPLGDMGTQNIQFGSAGLNVKFNFGGSR